jgi:ABC-type transport system involved in multi-copper enzyme maturation permease subunit
MPFFMFHPWLYLFLIPSVSMRLWAEERKTGTLELLLTLPVSLTQAVLGKFLAAWVFTGLALLLTFPMWLTVNYLGSPDNGVIFASYVGSWLMAGGSGFTLFRPQPHADRRDQKQVKPGVEHKEGHQVSLTALKEVA